MFEYQSGEEQVGKHGGGHKRAWGVECAFGMTVAGQMWQITQSQGRHRLATGVVMRQR